MRYIVLISIFYNSIIVLSPVSVPDGGTGNTLVTSYAVLCGGTQNFASVQSVASVGSAGQPLVSNGAGSLPSFQTLPVSGGGTNTTSISSGVVQSNGTTLSSLGVGSNGQILKNTSGTVGWSSVNILQIVSTSTSAAVSTAGTVIPNDDTIPQNTEGTQILSASITPQSASSNLLISCQTGGSPTSGASNSTVLALFVDSTANALAAQFIGRDNASSSGRPFNGTLVYITPSSSTTARTYSIRAGGGDFLVNANSGGTRMFGGVAATSLVIIEYI